MRLINTLCYFLLGSIAISMPGCTNADKKDPRPNILIIMADDMGWADLGFNGGKSGLTPNINRLATEGTRLTQFYMTPVCATTRAALMIGRYPFRQWMDWRSEDFGKPDYLAMLGMEFAHLPDGTPTRRIMGLV